MVKLKNHTIVNYDRDELRKYFRAHNIDHVTVNTNTLNKLQEIDALAPITKYSGVIKFTICNKLVDNVVSYKEWE